MVLGNLLLILQTMYLFGRQFVNRNPSIAGAQSMRGVLGYCAFCALLLLFFVPVSSFAQSGGDEKKINDTIAKMTLEEVGGQDHRRPAAILPVE